MATTNISLNSMVDWAAKTYQDSQYPQMREGRRNQILPISKYNLLVTGFNASTVLLTVAVAAAVLFAFNAAVFLGGAGLLIRFTAEKGIASLVLPGEEENGAHLGEHLARAALHALGLRQLDLAGARILQRLGAAPQENWHADRLVVADHVLWKNTVAVPE